MILKIGIIAIAIFLVIYFAYNNGKLQCQQEQKTEIIKIVEKDVENKSKIIALPNANRNDIINLMLNEQM